jgi:hypothetical protein
VVLIFKKKKKTQYSALLLARINWATNLGRKVEKKQDCSASPHTFLLRIIQAYCLLKWWAGNQTKILPR